MIDASAGLSTEGNSYEAGKNAAKEALAGMTSKPKLIILAVDGITRKKFDYDQVIKGVRDILGPEPRLIGSTVNGILVNDRFACKSVGIMLLGGDIEVEKDFCYGQSRISYEKISTQIMELTKSIPKTPNKLLLMFQDGIKFPPEVIEQQKMLNSRVVSLLSGIVGKIFANKLTDFQKAGKGMSSVQEVIQALYSKGWNTPIIGNVATGLKDYHSHEFYDNKTWDDACMGALLNPKGDAKFGIGYAAGAIPTGYTCKATKNIGNFLLKIDDKPALDGFCDAVKIEPQSLYNLKNEAYMNFYYMMGTTEKWAGKDVTHLVGTITNPDMPNLVTSAFPFNGVPETISIYRSDPKILMQTAKESVEKALSEIDDPRFFLGIDCIIRFLAYGDNFPRVIQMIKEKVGKDVPRMVLGSGGEIFGFPGIKSNYYFNNFTFVTLAGGTAKKNT